MLTPSFPDRVFAALGVLALIALVALTAPVLAEVDEEDRLGAQIMPPWDGQSRFTVLLLGMDRRPGARDTLNTRTDTIILVSIDPQTERIGLLHIPRDLHLTPPGSERFVRANTLMIQGEDLQEGYGPYYVIDTLQYNLGMYIDRFVVLDFEAFTALVDAIGGVEIDLSYNISDPDYPDMNYGYDPFFLRAGTHLLDGETALKFARTRHGDNDYLRGIRQMKVLTALHEQLTEADSLPQLLHHAPQLLRELHRNLYTDFSLEDIAQLARHVSAIPPGNIDTGAINEAHIISYPVDGRTLGYIPDRARLAEVLIDTFGENYNH
jgi:polyisoprenyl-teichoic acid--peptidoglycan teichoic acid transferase